jgi:hypothetical protein
MTLSLPDWNLLYVEYHGKLELAEIRRAIMQDEDLRIVKVTDERIYFVE